MISNNFQGGGISINSDYAYCKEVTRQGSKSFFAAFSRLPLTKAQAVYAIYAFCRWADDLVDNHRDLMGLNELRASLDSFSQGNTPDHPVWRALRDSFANFALTPEPFYLMLDGQARDLGFQQPQSLTQLKEYSFYVAGSVGLMLLPVVAVKNHRELRGLAITLGEAMQLTNILRDVGEDYRRERIYLPTEMMSQYGVRAADLGQGIVTGEFIALWQDLANEAQNLFTQALAYLPLVDRDSRFPLLLAINYYQAILGAVRRGGHDCLNHRHYVSAWEKAALLINTSAQIKNLRLREGEKIG
jgi:phytoene synthase